MGQKIRKGNDIRITWSLYDADEHPYNLDGRTIDIELNTLNKRVRIDDFTTSGNSVIFTYYGKDQKYTGSFALKFIENEGQPDMVTFDTKDAFTLTEHSWQAVDAGETPETIQLEVVTISDNLNSNIGPKGDNAGFGTIDAEVDANVGTPSVSVQTSGPDTAKNILFSFHNLKGDNADVTRENIEAALDGTPGKNLSTEDYTTAEKNKLDALPTSSGLATLLAAKQDVISDLSTIRSGAAAGATAYQKPNSGIPASDLAEGVIPDVSQFITNSVNDLVNYYLKSETYTKAEVQALIGAIQSFHYEIYPTLADVTTPANNVLYLIGPTGTGADRYEEYIYPNAQQGFVKIGDTSIDLSGYVTTSALNTVLANYTLSVNIPVRLGSGENSIEQKRTGAIASGDYSHAEGVETIASGMGSHAEGYSTTASGRYSHAEGESTTASGICSHAEGEVTIASGIKSHAEGYNAVASGDGSHAEGVATKASGNYSHAEGSMTEAFNTSEHAQGQYNVSHHGSTFNEKTIHSVGVGEEDDRKNAMEVMKNGDVYILGVGGYDGTNPGNAETVQTAINSKYQKPSGGIPASDMASGVQTSLRNADSAYQKPSGGIPSTDLTSEVQTSLGKADAALPAADVVDNLTTDDATKVLSAKQGKVLDGKVSQLGQKVNTFQSTPDNDHYPSEKLVYDSLYKRGVISQTQTWTHDANYVYSYVMSDLIWGNIPKLNIDMFEAAGATFNDTTGYFELNGLTDISYREMQQIALNSTFGLKYAINLDRVYTGVNARTVYPLITVDGYRAVSAREAFNASGYLEVIKFSPSDSLVSLNYPNYCFRECHHLKTIIGIFTVLSDGNTAFYNNRSLENITFVPKVSVSFYASSALSLASVVYMVENAANTSAITITLHATAYARCQADTTEYTYSGQTYTGIIAYATAKNITIQSA